MILSLLLATTLRTLLVIISFGCKVPAGIFVPSMAIGAAFGRTIGILVQALHEAFPALLAHGLNPQHWGISVGSNHGDRVTRLFP